MKPEIAFITGASRGIGRAIAQALGSAGMHLAINARDEVRLRALAEELSKKYSISCRPFAGDIGDSRFVEMAFEQARQELGPITILVNNAGISHVGLLADMSLEEWKRVMDTNLNALFYCCKSAIPQMLSGGAGKIVNISSVWGSAGASCEVAYSAAKGGMNAFTKALAKELGPGNIQVNAIACGVIDSEMNHFLSQEEKEQLKGAIPQGRFGTPQEVGELALALLRSPSYLTGQIISLDGAWM